MKTHRLDTPPSSVAGDDISVMDEEDAIYLEDMEEVQIEDLESLEGNDYLYMEPPEDHSKLVFSKHIGSVFCCDLHPDGILAVTGGEDDKAYVWNTETGQVIMECGSHKDSVVFVGFSFDGAYLATADMAGLIKVWKVEGDMGGDGGWTIAFEYETDDLTFGLWHFGTRVLICGTVSGNIYVFKIPSGDTKVLQGHNCKTECGKLFPDGVRLAVGYDDGSIKVWDLKTCTSLQTIPPTEHNTRVSAIDTHPENNLMASISSDGTTGTIVLTTSTTGKFVGQHNNGNDLEAVAFASDPELGYFALGTLTGAVTIWDVSRQLIRHYCTTDDDEDISGVTKIIWVNNYVVTSCLDGSLKAYEGRSGEKYFKLTGHQSEILDFCYNSKTNIILTASDDGTARIFKCEFN